MTVTSVKYLNSTWFNHRLGVTNLVQKITILSITLKMPIFWYTNQISYQSFLFLIDLIMGYKTLWKQLKEIDN